jgi:hypothetical protein
MAVFLSALAKDRSEIFLVFDGGRQKVLFYRVARAGTERVAR